MIAAVLGCALAGLTFLPPAEAPGLWAGGPKPLSGEPLTNYRPADLDGDGAPELVFADGVWFQRGGWFPGEGRVSLPEKLAGKTLDVFGGDLYGVGGGRLVAARWTGEAFEVLLDQPLDTPMDDRGGVSRFLHDLDGDGTPEMVCAEERGLQVFARRGDEYRPAGLLEVYPDLSLEEPPASMLWPKPRRQLTFPARRLSCDVTCGDMTVAVLFPQPGPGGRPAYARRTHTLAQDGGIYVAAPSADVWRGRPVEPFLRPCRLNNDNIPDFAGTRLSHTRGRVLNAPVMECWATLDGGKTFAVRRSVCVPGFRPQGGFMDMDGDGLADLVTEGSPLFDGGARETAAHLTVRQTLPHTVRVYRQTPGGFSEEPSPVFQTELDLGGSIWEQPPALARYAAGHLVSYWGDFDGDGRRDVMARTGGTRVEVFLARDGAFAGKPDAVLPVAEEAQVSTADVNGDGCWDVVARTAGPEGDAGQTLVFRAARGNAP
ncbi:MAG TPA: VCBS repeat-containing protein [Candidatus Hydrogenedentes bacterium]|nr:VCBS repeat-containing protein [Candidatus Hydrogenedentota bacterium]